MSEPQRARRVGPGNRRRHKDTHRVFTPEGRRAAGVACITRATALAARSAAPGSELDAKRS